MNHHGLVEFHDSHTQHTHCVDWACPVKTLTGNHLSFALFLSTQTQHVDVDNTEAVAKTITLLNIPLPTQGHIKVTHNNKKHHMAILPSEDFEPPLVVVTNPNGERLSKNLNDITWKDVFEHMLTQMTPKRQS